MLNSSGSIAAIQRADITVQHHASNASGFLRDGLVGEADRLKSGDFCIDYLAMEVTYRGREVPLSLTQYQILVFLTKRPRVVVSLDDLMLAVWETCYVSRNNIHVHIHFIRKALAAAGATVDLIKTVRGAGYRFDPPGPIE